MKNVLSLFVLALVLTLPLAYAMNSTTNSMTTNSMSNTVTPSNSPTSSNAAANVVVNTIVTESNATSAQIFIGTNYLTGRFGSNYTKAYVNFSHGSYFSDINATLLYYTYKIPFTNGSTTSGLVGDNSSSLESYAFIGIALNNSNDIIDYFGPTQPITISVSKTNALSIASTYGIKNASAIIEGAANGNQAPSLSAGYLLVWAVFSHNLIPYGSGINATTIYPGVYVDAQNGTILGQFGIDPHVPPAEGNQTFGQTSNFNLYNLSAKQPNPVITQSYVNNTAVASGNGSSGVLMYGAVGIVVIIAIILLYYFAVMKKGKSSTPKEKAPMQNEQKQDEK